MWHFSTFRDVIALELAGSLLTYHYSAFEQTSSRRPQEVKKNRVIGEYELNLRTVTVEPTGRMDPEFG